MLELNIQKTMIMASSPITSWQTEGGKAEGVPGGNQTLSALSCLCLISLSAETGLQSLAGWIQ